MDIVSGGDDSVHNVPDGCCNTRAAVCTTVMEDFGQPTTKPERGGMWTGNGDLINKVDEILLTEEKRHHEVGGCCCPDVRRKGPSFIAGNEDNECNKISCKDDREDLPIVGKEDVWNTNLVR